MSYFGLKLLLNLSLPLVFAALAQMFVITVGDIDLGIGPFIALVELRRRRLPRRPAGARRGAARRLRRWPMRAMGALIHLRRLPSIVVTLGASFVWLGLALLLLPSPGGTAPAWLQAAVRWQPPYVPLPILVAVAAGLLGQVLLMRTSYGVVLRGVGGNPRAVERAGWSLLNGARRRSTALAGAARRARRAGAGRAEHHRATPMSAASYTLLSIAAVIVGGGEFFGGIVSPIGAVVGALIMLLTGSLLSFLNVSTDWQLSAQGVILIVVLASRALVRRGEA